MWKFETATRLAANRFDAGAIFAKLGVAKPILNQAEGIPPAEFFALFQTPAIQKQM